MGGGYLVSRIDMGVNIRSNNWSAEFGLGRKIARKLDRMAWDTSGVFGVACKYITLNSI
jgi:hypothetical protein